MKNFIWAFLIAISLTACATTDQSSQQPIQSPYQSLYDQRIKDAETMSVEIKSQLILQSPKLILENVLKNVVYGLKDPDSAKFRNVRFVKYNNQIVVCGEVNAKNSYGGYVGFSEFISGITSSKIIKSAEYQTAYGAADSAGFRTYCLLGEEFNP